MGVRFAHNSPQTQSYVDFKGVFGVVQPSTNMDSPQHSGDATAVETVCIFNIGKTQDKLFGAKRVTC